jgi:hypothetical protein
VRDDWRTQPLYYYLTIDFERLAPMLYERWLDLVGRQRRVWIVFWEDDEPPAEMLAALTGHEVTLRVEEREASAWLFEPRRSSERR